MKWSHYCGVIPICTPIRPRIGRAILVSWAPAGSSSCNSATRYCKIKSWWAYRSKHSVYHQNLREQAWARPAAFDRQAGHRRLHDRLASTTAQLRADMTDHLEAGGDVFQHLTLVLADAAEHRAAAAGAGAGCFVRDDLARKVWRQRLADGLFAFPPLAGLPGVGIAGGVARLGCTGVRFEFADQQFELLDRVVELLGGAAEVRAAQYRQLHFQLLDVQRLGMDLGRIGRDLDILACQLSLQIHREAAQRGRVFRQRQDR